LNGIEAREEETTAAGHADPDNTQEEREHPETLEGMGQSANGTVPAGKNMSGTGEPGSGDPDSEESNNEGSSNEESGSEDIEEANHEPDKDQSDSEQSEGIYHPFVTAVTFRSDCAPPSLLFVCQESRTLASKYYQKTFGTPNAPANTYFDLDRDTIYVLYDVFSPNARYFEEFIEEMFRVREGGLMTVKNAVVLVDETFQARRGDLHQLLVADMLERVFPRLEKLTIVLAHWAPEHHDDKSPICFIETIDYEATILNYGLFPPGDGVWQYQGEPNRRWLCYAKLRPTFLKETILRSMKAGDLPPLIPSIDYKLAINGSDGSV
jgi:hypothetical protein